MRTIGSNPRKNLARAFGLAASCALAAACGSSTPAPAAAGITVAGTEHFAWDQVLQGGEGISTYSFVAYVDDVRQPLPDATCAQGADQTMFSCSAKLPSMTAGAHRLQVAAVDTSSGTPVESAKSPTLNLNVVPPPGTSPSARRALPRSTLKTADGTALAVDTLATGLDRPSAVVPTPDGRVFVAEETGTVRVWSNGALDSTPAARLGDAARLPDLGLVGLTLDPTFARTGRLYVAYTARLANGTLANRIVRFREVGGVFGEQASILEDPVGVLPERPPRVRMGPDGKLYAVFPTNSSDQAHSSYMGRLLRLNQDGTTPRDNPGFSPVISTADVRPSVWSWQPATNELWGIVQDAAGRQLLQHGAAVLAATAMTIDPAIDVSSASFYSGTAIGGFSGDLFVSTLADRQIRRLRFDTTDRTRVVGSEHLLDGEYGRIADLAEGSDGAVYFCTSNGADASSGDDRLLRIAADRIPERAVVRK